MPNISQAREGPDLSGVIYQDCTGELICTEKEPLIESVGEELLRSFR